MNILLVDDHAVLRSGLADLLRGRGGTEPEAAKGHAAQTPVVLVDDSLVPLDPLLVPPLASSRIAAIGTGDADAVIAPLANPGLSRRPQLDRSVGLQRLVTVGSSQTGIEKPRRLATRPDAVPMISGLRSSSRAKPLLACRAIGQTAPTLNSGTHTPISTAIISRP